MSGPIGKTYQAECQQHPGGRKQTVTIQAERQNPTPLERSVETYNRNREICERFEVAARTSRQTFGEIHDELAVEFGIAARTVKKIISLGAQPQSVIDHDRTKIETVGGVYRVAKPPHMLPQRTDMINILGRAGGRRQSDYE